MAKIYRFQEQFNDLELNFLAALFAVFGCAALIGNAITIIAFRIQPKLLTKSTVALKSLAIADFMVGIHLILMAIQLSSRINFYMIEWEHEEKMYLNVVGVIINSLQHFPSLLAGTHVMLISIERHLAIKNPMKYYTKFTIKKATLAVIVIWIITIVANFTPAVLITVFYFINRLDLVLRLRLMNSVILGGTEFLFYVIVVIDLFIMFILLQRSRHSQSLNRDGSTNNTQDPNHVNGSTKNTSLEKALKTYLVILLYFAITHAPYFATVVISNQNIGAYKAHYYLSFLGSSNSCMNIFLYVFVNPSFRRTIKNILLFKCKHKFQQKITVSYVSKDNVKSSSAF